MKKLVSGLAVGLSSVAIAGSAFALKPKPVNQVIAKPQPSCSVESISHDERSEDTADYPLDYIDTKVVGVDGEREVCLLDGAVVSNRVIKNPIDQVNIHGTYVAPTPEYAPGGYNAVGCPKNQYVNGYMRKNGTYVQGYYRNSPSDGCQ